MKIVYRPAEDQNAEPIISYYCDCCGLSDDFSDFRWEAHKHWEETNYTLCFECIRKIGSPPGGEIISRNKRVK